ncbi:MAG TPA: CheR family methyltransferase [Chthoniobacterales bacterium]
MAKLRRKTSGPKAVQPVSGSPGHPAPETPDAADLGTAEALASPEARLPLAAVATRWHAVPVVGIGGELGGLEALERLLAALPARCGVAFVVVQHANGKDRHLVQQLRRWKGPLTVCPVETGIAVEPEHLYVNPPDANVTITRGTLKLEPQTLHNGQPMPIDIFLRSLAGEQGDRSIAVVLSGANTDGALGIEAVKAVGGITFAQEPSTAKSPVMPRAAISTGCVDFVLSPPDIGEEISRIDRHPYLRVPVPDEAEALPDGLVPAPDRPPDTQLSLNAANGADGHDFQKRDPEVQRILALLRNSVGVDFTQYKPATVQRRIHRRMALLRIESPEDYARFLRGNETELLALYQDILIKVTSFFRDPGAFENLRTKVLPRLLKSRDPLDTLRIWVPGCSTGEEAYSIAICVAEYLGSRRAGPPVQIFATDLSEASLDRARDGNYLENIALDVSPERLERFFTRAGHGFRINKSIREMVIFARQDLAKDPPFSRLDLISCRNVLIYLEAAVQKKVFPLFHYALRPGGYLLLGSSETVGEFTDLFSEAGRKERLFLRKNTSNRVRLGSPAASLPGQDHERAQTLPADSIPAPPSPNRWEANDGTDQENFNLLREANSILLQRYTPPGVLVNGDFDVIQFHGQGHSYFEPAPGKVTFNLLKLLKEGLAVHVRTAVAASRQDRAGYRKRVAYTDHGTSLELELEVLPLRMAQERDRHYLILFHPPSTAAESSAGGTVISRSASPAVRNKSRDAREIAELRRDLENTRQYLQSIIEEQDAANEEIKSANEEILSSNEELQSTNEELETAKEELQSSNEELITVNEELQTRNIELGHANNDLVNLINSIHFAIVMLSEEGRVRRFTPMAGRLFNLIPTDLGRPFSDIQSKLQVPDLSGVIEEVVRTITGREMEVQALDGRWYSLSVRPYRTSENKIEGAVLALVDIDDLKRGLEELKRSRDFSQAVLTTVRQPLLVLDAEFRVRLANAAFYDLFAASPEGTVGQFFYTLPGGQWNLSRLRRLLGEVLSSGSRIQNLVVEYEGADSIARRLILNGRRIDADNDRPAMVLLTIEDSTDRRQTEQEVLAVSERERRRMAQELHDGLGQQLTAIAFVSQSILHCLQQGDGRGAGESAEQLLVQVNEATALTRDMAKGLHPIQLEAKHFHTAMRALANNVSNLFKIVCTFHGDEPSPPPADTAEGATELYRITQEAINNSLKHGKATRIAITYRLDPESNQTRLVVSDNGTGFQKGAVLPSSSVSGMGLQIMRYRAASIGGRFRVERGSPDGVILIVTFGEPRNDDELDPDHYPERSKD